MSELLEKNIEKQTEVEIPVISIKDLHKSFGKVEVLKGINIEVRKGEVFGLIGKNGIGKSTTIDCMVGLKRPTSGDVLIEGHDIEREPNICKKMFGYVPSDPITYEMMTGNEYLQFIGSSFGMSQEGFDGNYSYLLKKFDLSSSDANKKIKNYSHGMKQKICLMASVIHNPDLWILDEPTVGLDVMVYDVLVDMIKNFAKGGKTVFITSHNIDMVSEICDRVAIINNGVIVETIDFHKEPLKRRDLHKIFVKIYGEDK